VQSRLALRKGYLVTLALADFDLFLGTPQQKNPAVTVCHRIHLACRQFLQAFLGLVQPRD
jgi:hypothetical protein